MRVPFSSLSNELIYQLNDLNTRQTQLQAEAATGQRVTLPGDDPAAVQRVLSFQVEGATTQQHLENISVLKEQASASLDAMQAVQKVSDRVGEIATLADGTKSPEELKVYATEIDQLIRQAVQSMNGTFNGEYLFGGTRTDQPPFVVAEDAQGKVSSVSYQGNVGTPEVRISTSETVSVKVPGANTTGTGPVGVLVDSRVGADFFNHLLALEQHLNAGDTASIAATDRQALSQDADNLTLHLGQNAALQSRLDTAAGLARSRNTSLTGLISNEAGADLSQTLVNLTATQNAYRAALQSGAALMQQSLLDYLK